MFMTWLAHARTGTDGAPGEVLAGPGSRPVRSARRVNVVLTAVETLNKSQERRAS